MAFLSMTADFAPGSLSIYSHLRLYNLTKLTNLFTQQLLSLDGRKHRVLDKYKA